MVSKSDPRHPHNSFEGLTKPDPREYASQIVAWAICWPWNLVWTLCVNNPFRYLIEFAFQEIRAAFDEISSGQFESIEQDLLLDDGPALTPQSAALSPGQLYQSYASAPVTEVHPAQTVAVSPPVAKVSGSNAEIVAAAELRVPPTPVDTSASVAALPANEAPAEGTPEEVLSTPARRPAPIWTPPVQRPLIIEPPPTLAELTRPDDVTYGQDISSASPIASPVQKSPARRPIAEIDEAGGSVVTPDDPWYSSWKAIRD